MTRLLLAAAIWPLCKSRSASGLCAWVGPSNPNPSFLYRRRRHHPSSMEPAPVADVAPNACSACVRCRQSKVRCEKPTSGPCTRYETFTILCLAECMPTTGRRICRAASNEAWRIFDPQPPRFQCVGRAYVCKRVRGSYVPGVHTQKRRCLRRGYRCIAVTSRQGKRSRSPETSAASMGSHEILLTADLPLAEYSAQRPGGTSRATCTPAWVSRFS